MFIFRLITFIGWVRFVWASSLYSLFQLLHSYPGYHIPGLTPHSEIILYQLLFSPPQPQPGNFGQFKYRFTILVTRAQELRRIAKKQLDLEQREQFDMMRTPAGHYESRNCNAGFVDDYEVFKNGPFHR